MKTVLQFIIGACTLLCQPLIYETSDWGITYLNAHSTLIKVVPLLIGLGFSIVFTASISPISNAKKPPLVSTPSKAGATVNPFWGWLAMCLVITFVINMMLE
jgi:hypothetical protein